VIAGRVNKKASTGNSLRVFMIHDLLGLFLPWIR